MSLGFTAIPTVQRFTNACLPNPKPKFKMNTTQPKTP